MNVDNLKIIQLGITLAKEEGRYPYPYGGSTWQFNFKFDLQRDTFLQESINLLEEAGIDFPKFNLEGIDCEYFAENFISSGIVLNENIKWITFHGAYDLAYLLKSLSNQYLPEDELSFFEDLGVYFPNFYDLRYMIRNLVWLKGSLSKIACDLDVDRIGVSHQAGSDSLITSKVFFKLLENYGELINLNEDKNKLFGFEFKNEPGSIIKSAKRNFPMGSGSVPANIPLNLNQTGSTISGVGSNFYPYQPAKTNMYYPSPYNMNTHNMMYNPNYSCNYANPNQYDFGYNYGYIPNYGIRK